MNFIATIEDGIDIKHVAQQLQKLGYTIERVRPFGRNISGNTGNKTLKDLRSVKGIRSAEIQRNIYKA